MLGKIKDIAIKTVKSQLPSLVKPLIDKQIEPHEEKFRKLGERMSSQEKETKALRNIIESRTNETLTVPLKKDSEKKNN